MRKRTVLAAGVAALVVGTTPAVMAGRAAEPPTAAAPIPEPETAPAPSGEAEPSTAVVDALAAEFAAAREESAGFAGGEWGSDFRYRLGRAEAAFKKDFPPAKPEAWDPANASECPRWHVLVARYGHLGRRAAGRSMAAC